MEIPLLSIASIYMHRYSDRPSLSELQDLRRHDQSPRILNPNIATHCWSGYHSIINIPPPFEGGPFRKHQTYLGSTQTSHEIEAWSTHLQPTHLCQHIGSLHLTSTQYHECSDTGSLCALTYHGTLGSL
jgi:hypothetical protein